MHSTLQNNWNGEANNSNLAVHWKHLGLTSKYGYETREQRFSFHFKVFRSVRKLHYFVGYVWTKKFVLKGGGVTAPVLWVCLCLFVLFWCHPCTPPSSLPVCGAPYLSLCGIRCCWCQWAGVAVMCRSQRVWDTACSFLMTIAILID